MVLAACGSIGACAAGFAGSTAAMIALLSLAVGGCLSMLGPFWALAAATLSESTSAAGIAIINSLGNFGGFFGPRTVGALVSVNRGYSGGMMVVGTAVLLGGLIALLIRPRGVPVPN